jgi:hypothetical protein
MANPTGGFGLKPIRTRSGAPWTVEKVYISSSYATALYIGTPVLLSPTLAEKDTTGRYQTVNIAVVDSGVYYGVIVGFEPDPDNLSRLYNPASTERTAYVVRSKDVVFAVRGDGGGTPSKVFIGQNAAMIATSAGSTSTGLSGWELDEGTTNAPNTTQTFPLQIIGIQEKEDNTLADDAVYEVILNTTELAAGDVIGITAA